MTDTKNMDAELFYGGVLKDGSEIEVFTVEEFNQKCNSLTNVIGPFVAPSKQSALRVYIFILNEFINHAS